MRNVQRAIPLSEVLAAREHFLEADARLGEMLQLDVTCGANAFGCRHAVKHLEGELRRYVGKVILFTRVVDGRGSGD